MDECERGDVLLDTVFEDLEVVLGEIGHDCSRLLRMIASIVTKSTPERKSGWPGWDVEGAEGAWGAAGALGCWCLGCRWCCRCLGCLRRQTHRPGRQSHCEACRQTGRIELHDDSIRRSCGTVGGL